MKKKRRKKRIKPFVRTPILCKDIAVFHQFVCFCNEKIGFNLFTFKNRKEAQKLVKLFNTIYSTVSDTLIYAAYVFSVEKEPNWESFNKLQTSFLREITAKKSSPTAQSLYVLETIKKYRQLMPTVNKISDKYLESFCQIERKK